MHMYISLFSDELIMKLYIIMYSLLFSEELKLYICIAFCSVRK